MSEGRKPDFIAKTVRKDEKTGEDRWTDIGVAFVNAKSETITILLNALPMTDRLVLAKPFEKEEKKTFNPLGGGG